MSERKLMAAIGPRTISLYPDSAWSESVDFPLENIWQLCGPTVDRFIGKLPIWKVFALCYAEGAAHAVAAIDAARKK